MGRLAHAVSVAADAGRLDAIVVGDMDHANLAMLSSTNIAEHAVDETGLVSDGQMAVAARNG